MSSLRLPGLRAAVVAVALPVVVLGPISACGNAPDRPAAPAGPTSTTVALGPRSTVTIDVTGADPPPRISVATLSIRQGGLEFRDVRTGSAPVHERFPFVPPPGVDSMGVVVRFFGDGQQSVDCEIRVDGRTVDREQRSNGCSYSSDPRWTHLLAKGVVPGRYWPPGG